VGTVVESLYLYGLVHHQGSLSFSAAGMEGREIFTVSYLDLAFLASASPREKYEPSPEYVACHNKVLEGVLAMGLTPLPVRFGTLAPSGEVCPEEKVVQLLRRHFGQFHRLLYPFEDGMEIGLTVCWRELPFEQVLAQDEGLRAFRDQVLATAGGYVGQVELGRRVALVLDGLREAQAQEMLARLRPLAIDMCRHRIYQEQMVLDCAFLIPWENRAPFEVQVADMALLYPDMDFHFTGPTPPFSFVELVIPWEEE
jgi:hypothetical protein